VSTLALVIYAGWYYPRLGNQYGLQTYAWTNALFIGFLILCFFWMRYRNPVYSALIFIVFITTFFFYPTTPLWMFSIMVFTAAALKLRNWLASERVNYSWSIPLFMLVFYFTFDTAFYGNFLNRVKSEISGETLVSSFLSRIIAPIIIDKNIVKQPFVEVPLSPPLATWATLISYLIMMLPIGYWMINQIYKAARNKSLIELIETDKKIFLWAIILATLTHLIGYAGYGAVSIRLVPLTFPIIMLLVFDNKKLVDLLMISLAGISIIGFISHVQAFQSDPIMGDLANGPRLLRDGTVVASDPNVFALSQIQLTTGHKESQYAWITPDIYSALTNNLSLDTLGIDYYLTDKLTRPIIAASWEFLDTWIKHIHAIESSQFLHKVYDSGRLSIFQEKDQPLPRSPDQPDIGNGLNNSMFWKYAVFLLLALLFLFLPGGALLWFLHDLLDFRDSMIYLGLSFTMSLCVIVLIGYVFNFIFMALDLLAGFIILLSLIIIVVTIVFIGKDKSKKRFISLQGGILLSVVLMIIVAFGSTYVAFERVASRRISTEFYLTQDPGFGLRLHIINQEDDSNIYTLSYQPSEKTAQEISVFELPPHHIYQVNIEENTLEEHGRSTWLLVTGDAHSYTIYLNPPP
jgi:hypothetical protein